MGASMPNTLSIKLNRIAEMAKRSPTYQFTTIAHLINVDLMEHAFEKIRKDAAVGVDGRLRPNCLRKIDDGLDR